MYVLVPGRSGLPWVSAEVRASGTKVRNVGGGEGKTEYNRSRYDGRAKRWKKKERSSVMTC